jgi:hypothetical protein
VFPLCLNCFAKIGFDAGLTRSLKRYRDGPPSSVSHPDTLLKPYREALSRVIDPVITSSII